MADSRLDIEIADLRGLVALVRERSVTRAAKRVAMTQSGMSHLLARLRMQFDDEILVRGERGMTPTERASALADHAERILAEIHGIGKVVARFDPLNDPKTFTIAADDNMTVTVVLPLLVEWMHSAPKVTVRVVPVPKQVMSAFEREGIDLVIDMKPVDEPSLCCKRILSESFVGMVRSGNPILAGAVTVEAFCTARHVVVSTQLPDKSFVDQRLAEMGLERRVAVRVPHFLAAIKLVSQTDLVITAAKRLANATMQELSLRTFEPPIELPEIAIYQLWHERTQTSPAHVWLRSQIAAAATRSGSCRG